MSYPERRCNGIVHCPGGVTVEQCGETATHVCSGPGPRPIQWYACEKREHRLNEDGSEAERITVKAFFDEVFRGMPETPRNSRMK